MSIKLQNQIRQNMEDMRTYLKDLDTWKDEIETKKQPPKRSEINYPIRGFNPENSQNQNSNENRAKDEKTVKVNYSKKADTLQLLLVDKLEANNYFKKRNYEEASRLYTKVVTTIDKEKLLNTEENNKELLELYISCYSNLSQCCFISKKFNEVIRLCRKVLSLEPGHLKSLFRLSRAYKLFKDYRNAEFYLKKGLSLIKTEDEGKEFKSKLMVIEKIKEKRVEGFKKSIVLPMPASGKAKRRLRLKDIKEEIKKELNYEDFFKEREENTNNSNEFLKLKKIDIVCGRSFEGEFEYPNDDDRKKVRFVLPQKKKCDIDYEELA